MKKQYKGIYLKFDGHLFGLYSTLGQTRWRTVFVFMLLQFGVRMCFLSQNN